MIGNRRRDRREDEMKHLLICFVLSGTWLVAQEEADTTFLEDDEFMMEDEEADTTDMIETEATPEASPTEGLAYGYKVSLKARHPTLLPVKRPSIHGLSPARWERIRSPIHITSRTSVSGKWSSTTWTWRARTELTAILPIFTD